MVDEPAPDLFYAEVIASHVTGNPRFHARPWLADRLDALLGDPGCRFVLLTADTGAGKSSALAWLAHLHPDWPRYFIRRDQFAPLADPGVRSFLLRTGYQLAARIPDVFAPDRVRIAVEQRIGSVAAGGTAVGATIERLLGSPFQQTVVRIRQHVRDNAGDVTGVRIGELVDDARRLDVDDLQFLALLDPATTLAALRPDARIVVLVDALDEIRYRGSGESVLDWLAQCPRLPSNVRIVVASRPDDALLRTFRNRQRQWLRELTIAGDDPDVAADLRGYVDDLVAESPVAARLGGTDSDRARSFVAVAAERAHGNIGYLDAVGRAIDTALAADDPDLLDRVLTLVDVAAGVGELFAALLHQLGDLAGRTDVAVRDPVTARVRYLRAWPAVHRRVLGVLAVAREPLTADQIRRLGAIDAGPEFVVDALQLLGHLLTRTDNRFRLYHASLVDFLTAEATATDPDTADLAVRPAEWHATVVASYRGTAASWADVAWPSVDGYGLRHLAGHLDDLDPGQLQDLLNRGFIRAKLAGSPSPQPLAADVALVVDAARRAEPPDLAALFRACLVEASLGSLTAAVPPETVGVLAATGPVTRATGYASLIPDPRQRVAAYRAIARSVASPSPTGPEALRAQETRTAALRAAAAAAEAVTDPAGRVRAVAGVAADRAAHPYDGQCAGTGTGEADDAAARTREALRSVDGLDADGRIVGLADVAEAVAATGDRQTLDAIVDEVTGRAREWTLSTAGIHLVGVYPPLLLAVATALLRAGDRERAADLAREAAGSTVWPTFAPVTDAARVVAGLASVLARAGDPEAAESAFASALARVGDARTALDASLGHLAVAAARAEAGHDDAARELVERGLAVEGDGPELGTVFGRAAAVLVRTGDRDRAAELAERGLRASSRVGDELAVVETFNRVALALRDAGAPERAGDVVGAALAVVNTVDDRSTRVRVHADLGEALAGPAEVTRALAVPGAHRSDEFTAWLLCGVVAGVPADADPGEREAVVADACAAAEALVSPTARTVLLRDVAAALTRTGHPRPAGGILRRARESAAGIDDPAERIHLLAFLVPALLDAGDAGTAGEVTADARRLLADVTDPVTHDRACQPAATALARTGAYDEAVGIALAIRDVDPHLDAAASVAMVMAEAGRFDRVTALIDASALVFPENYPSLEPVLTSVVVNLARRGEGDAAIGRADRITDPRARALALTHAAKALCDAGHLDGALTATDRIDVARLRDSTRAYVAVGFAHAGDRDRAVATADAVPDDLWRTVAMAGAARELARHGDHDAAGKLRAAALGLARAVSDPVRRAHAMIGFLDQSRELPAGVIATALLADAFVVARADGRERLLEVLRAGAPLLVRQGDTDPLWHLFRAATDVETWWGQ